ncbi:MAG: 50S ribosomal protein L30 [Candidatus Korarchaeota archaeon]
MSVFVIVRLKGDANLRRDTVHTLKLLGLHKVNHAVIRANSPSIAGMLQKAKDAIAWGEIDKETLKNLVLKRGRSSGNKKVDEEYFKSKNLSLDQFLDEILSGKKKLTDYGIKPVFRLHPTYIDKKRPFSNGGDLGYHGDKINILINKML